MLRIINLDRWWLLARFLVPVDCTLTGGRIGAFTDCARGIHNKNFVGQFLHPAILSHFLSDYAYCEIFLIGFAFYVGCKYFFRLGIPWQLAAEAIEK